MVAAPAHSPPHGTRRVVAGCELCAKLPRRASGAPQAALLDSFYGTQRGLTARGEIRAEINELISQLEAKNPMPNLTEVRNRACAGGAAPFSCLCVPPNRALALRLAAHTRVCIHAPAVS